MVGIRLKITLFVNRFKSLLQSTQVLLLVPLLGETDSVQRTYEDGTLFFLCRSGVKFFQTPVLDTECRH